MLMDGKLTIIKIPAYLRLIQGVHGIWSNDPKIQLNE